MKTPLILLLSFALPALGQDPANPATPAKPPADLPPREDREAILAMAGSHEITFHFEETTAVSPDYRLRTKAYDEDAREIIAVVEDRPTRITLQHLLVTEDEQGEPYVIKHWAQVWTWQDTELLDYTGEDGIHEWRKVRLSEEQAAGTWSQLVTQVDDTPRYEGYGRWTHARGESSWQSEPTRRPLPRREYSKRDDYDYLLVTNRHTLTPGGWAHFQDNRKVVDREGGPVHVLCFETGLNTYTRAEVPHGEAAEAWWSEHGPFWDEVRNFWVSAGEEAGRSFAYTTHKDGESLRKLLKRFQSSPPATAELSAALQPYLILR